MRHAIELHDHSKSVQLTLLVTDYDEAVEFYCKTTELFRLEFDFEMNAGYRHVVLSFADAKTMFTIRVELATTTEAKRAVGRQAGDQCLIVLPVDDFGKTLRECKARGVSVVDGPHDLPYGMQATLVDPFGNRICISESYVSR